MNKQEIEKRVTDYIKNSEDNFIKKDAALSDVVAGMKIFDEPIFAFGDADDPLFKQLKNPSVIGHHFKTPKEWLPQAKTVISFFLPFSESVRKNNRLLKTWPSEGWLHGRIEGQAFLNKVCQYLDKELVKASYKSVIPSLDKRFRSRSGRNINNLKLNSNISDLPFFTSNWSERHVAFVCGLGTFGLSKGLITKKGVAGRFGSIVTDLYLKLDYREYEGLSEYCSKCGDCITQCPANAISLEKGKNHLICSEFLDIIKMKYKPRYGCGKCQVNVSCESSIP